MASNNPKHPFLEYPFPKHLMVNIKTGHYLIIGDKGKKEIIQANNAKEALEKATLKQVSRLEYLGFYKKVILDSNELIENNFDKPENKPES